ncbi:MAG: hypothetical protein H5T86_05980 [Armatimonadetes bacterium]|nr:hypothetical protein [Armatimonadota bacterium]
MGSATFRLIIAFLQQGLDETMSPEESRRAAGAIAFIMVSGVVLTFALLRWYGQAARRGRGDLDVLARRVTAAIAIAAVLGIVLYFVYLWSLR